MDSLDLSIIIVSFNTRELLVACIESILQTVKNVAYEVIVVDNASHDGSVVEVQKLKVKNQNFNSKVKIIENQDNLGFSKANNIGVRKSRGRFLLFLNSDTVVYENTIDGMMVFMEKNPECGASTCFLRMPNGKLDDAAHRGFPTPWRAFCYFSKLASAFPKSSLFTGYTLSYLDLKKTHQIEALAGAFMLVRRIAGDQVGWWDEDYFFYGEDLDFCYKLKEKGWKIYFVPEYEILHYKGVSGGIKRVSQKITTADDNTKRRAIDARFAAMKIFYTKNYKKKYPAFISGLVFLGIDAKAFISRRRLR